MGLIQYAVLNDIHFPHESSAYERAIRLISHLPDLRGIYLNGDIGEIESVSSHPKSPLAQQSLLAELDYINVKLDELGKMFPGLPVTYIAGNHESRIYRYIRDVAPQMWGMADCPKLLNFDRRPGWKYVDYGPTQWVRCGVTRDLWLRHEPLGSASTNPAKFTAEKAYVSVLFGHCHTFSHYISKKQGPVPFTNMAMSCGWLGDINKTCFDYRGPKDNWVLGYTVVECEELYGDYEVYFKRLTQT